MYRHGPRTLPLAGWAGLFVFLALASMAQADATDQGARIYMERCLTCHGDVGQGLTDEWRATWAEGDRNCWIPACHGGNPPKPYGFTLPRTVPAVAGPGALSKFANAAQLHAFIASAMPMQEPGVLSDDEYWALTAYLLQINGAPAGGQMLNAKTAPGVLVPKSGQPVLRPQRTPSTPAISSMPAGDQSFIARASAPDFRPAATLAPATDTAPQAQPVSTSIVEAQSALPIVPGAQGLATGDKPRIWWPLPAVLLALAVAGMAAEANRRKGTRSS